MQKITFSFAFIALSTTMAHAADDEPAIKPTTVAINAIERTTAVLKQNPEALEKIDTIIAETGADIDETIEKIQQAIPAEKRKAAEKACKEDLKEAELAFKALFKQHRKKLEATVDATLGKENKEMIIAEAKELEARADARNTDLETSTSFKKLESDFNEAHQATALDIDVLTGKE